MPLYARIGMHLLFYGSLQASYAKGLSYVDPLTSWTQVRFLRWKAIRHLLKAESVRREFNRQTSHSHAFTGNSSHTEGKIYDSTDPDIVRAQIASFIETYSIDLSELAQPDLLAYKVFQYASAAIYSLLTEIIPF